MNTPSTSKPKSKRSKTVTTESVINDPTLRLVYLAGRRAGWLERNAVAAAERAGQVERMTDDAGRNVPPRTTASDARELFDLLSLGDI